MKAWQGIFLGLSTLALSACSGQPLGPDAGRALVEESAAAMGGWDAMNAIKSQEIITAGGDWEPLQALSPGSEPRIVNRFSQGVLADYENGRMRVAFDAQRVYPFQQRVRFDEVIEKDVASLETIDPSGKSTFERLHPSRRATRMRDFNRLPLRVLYTAKNSPDLRREADLPGAGRNTAIHVLKYTDGGAPVELHLGSFDKLPMRVIYMEDDPVEGDSANELVFSEWRYYDAVRMPQKIELFLNGKKLREEEVRTLINNPKHLDAVFVIRDEVRAQPENGEPIVSQWTLRRAAMGTAYADFGRAQKVELAQVAPGVHHVTGGSHHSMVVEFNDGLMVVEMPLFEERSEAVLAALEQKFPGKPVKYGVMTHFHMDHSGGIRAYAAKGATLFAPESVVSWVKETLSRPKTIRPDSLAKAGAPRGTVEGVADAKTISDGMRTVELRQIPNAHSEGLLIAYLPKERIAFVSDLYSPGNPIAPGDPSANALAFYDALVRDNLAVDRIVGGHGGVGSFRDLARFVSD